MSDLQAEKRASYIAVGLVVFIMASSLFLVI